MSAFTALEAKLTADTSGFTSGISEAVRSLGDLKTSAVGARKKIGLLGAAMGTAALGGIAKSVSAFGDFDAAMTESLAIMGDVSDSMESRMSKAARRVAKETTFSAEQAAESYFFLASAGLDAEQSLQALPQVAEFAQAGMFDMAEATEILTDAQSALGDETLTLTDLGDKLVKANTLANASVEQFGQALTNKAAPAMQRMGISTNEGIAALAVFADQGLKGRRAGTIFARTLEQLESKARNNKAAFEEFGVQVTDANGEMRPLKDIVRDMEGALGDMSTKQRQAALEQMGFNRRALQGIDLLMGNSDALAEYESGLSSAGGTTGEVADKQLDSFNAQMDLLMSRINDIFIGIGQELVPAIKVLVDIIDGAIKAFNKLDSMIGVNLGAVILVTTAIVGFTAAAGAAISVVAGLAGTILTLSTPILAVVAALGILISAWQSNFLGIRDVTASVVSAVKRLIGGMASTAKINIRQASKAINAIWNLTWSDVKTAVITAATAILKFLGTWGSRINGVIASALASVLSTVVSALRTLDAKVLAAFNAIVQTVASAANAILQAISNLASEAVSLVSGFVSDITNSITSLMNDVISLVESLASGFVSAIQGMASDTKSAVSDLVSSAVSQVTSLMNDVIALAGTIASEFVSKVQGMASDVVSAIATMGSDMLNALPSPGDFANAGRNLVGGLVSGIKSRISDVKNAAQDVAGAARNALPFSPAKEGPLKDLDKAGPAYAETFAKGIRRNTSEIESAAADAAGVALPMAATVGTGVSPTIGGGRVRIDQSLTMESGAISGVEGPEDVRREIEEWWRQKERRIR